MNNKGFTLIELLITVAIIGIISAIAITSYVGVTTKAARSEAYGNLETLRLLEEQFYAENGRYTIDLGVAGKTAATQTTNLEVIRDSGAIPDADIDELPGFRPGNDSNFVYRIIGVTGANPNGVELTGLPTNPLNLANIIQTDAARPPCFVAIATGLERSKVDGDMFAIDCNNVRNF